MTVPDDDLIATARANVVEALDRYLDAREPVREAYRTADYRNIRRGSLHGDGALIRAADEARRYFIGALDAYVDVRILAAGGTPPPKGDPDAD